VGVYLRLTPALRAVLGQLLATPTETWGLRLSTQTGRPTGTVYPLLERLEREGFVRSRWDDDESASGARRRLYSLTPTGHAWALMRLGEERIQTHD
jgi:PadR family transcriptional regulator, regulatory protein PadR